MIIVIICIIWHHLYPFHTTALRLLGCVIAHKWSLETGQGPWSQTKAGASEPVEELLHALLQLLPAPLGCCRLFCSCYMLWSCCTEAALGFTGVVPGSTAVHWSKTLKHAILYCEKLTCSVFGITNLKIRIRRRKFRHFYTWSWSCIF